MTSNSTPTPAEALYTEGMEYDWRQDKSPAAATLARAAFQQSATMGHTGALRSLAHMIFDGRGGGQDQKQALLLLWSAFRRGDRDALEELSDMLGSYAEVTSPSKHKQAEQMAQKVGEVAALVSFIESFMHELVRERAGDSG